VQTNQQQSPQETAATDVQFAGFSAWAFEWFAGLERDNSRDYFNATRERYELEVRGALSLMLQELTRTFGGMVRVFRQQNDMRFKPTFPYKTRTYGVLDFVAPVKPRLYADISSSGLYAGTGYPHLTADQLSRYRAAVIDDQFGASLAGLLGVAQAAGIELIGDTLTSAPRGYPSDHQRVALLKLRSVLVGRVAAGESGIARDDALNHVAGTWQAAEPITRWLDEHVGPSTVAPRERWPRRPVKPEEPGP
jgi:uncharacterized protein (DUF2461 family)